VTASKCRTVTAHGIFNNNGNRKWFKNKYNELVSEKYTGNERDELIRLYENQQHISVFNDMITEMDIKVFLDELFSAFNIVGMKRTKFVKPRLVNEKVMMEHLSIEYKINQAAHKIDEAFVYGILDMHISGELLNEIAVIRDRLINLLVVYFSKFAVEELENLSEIELLELVQDCLSESSLLEE